MRTLPRLAALALLAASSRTLPAEPPATQAPPTPLHVAVAAGWVEAHGEKPVGYASVEVTVRNVGSGPRAVELSGSHLVPENRGSCQRLGLGPAKPHPKVRKGPRTVVVDLEAGESATLRMGTCCLDVRLPAPSSQRFEAATEALAPATAEVLRWWAEHPNTAQGSVNSAVWKRQAVVDPSGGNARPTRRIAGYGGVVYQITRDGDLSSLDADGVRRPLGAEIDAVFPTEQALYAVWRRRTGFDLYRLASTGEDGWVPVADLGEDSAVNEVLDLGSAGLLLLSDKSIRRVLPGGGVAAVQHLGETGMPTAHARARGRVDLVLHRTRQGRGTLGHVVDLGPGELVAHDVKPHWEQRLVIAGSAGVFALTHAGRLERRVGEGFRPLGLPLTFEQIWFVGRRHAWGLTGERELVAVDLERGVERSRARLPRSDLDEIDLRFTDWTIDGQTDDLLRCTSSTWQRVRVADGAVETLPAP